MAEMPNKQPRKTKILLKNFERRDNVGKLTVEGRMMLQDGSNMTGTDFCVNKPHCAAAVRLVYTQISPGHI